MNTSFITVRHKGGESRHNNPLDAGLSPSELFDAVQQLVLIYSEGLGDVTVSAELLDGFGTRHVVPLPMSRPAPEPIAPKSNKRK